MLSYHYDYLRPSLKACLLYIQFLANSFKNIRSVKNYASGAKTFIISCGGTPDNFSSPVILNLLKGATNASTHEEHQAPALPRPVLFALCDGLRQLGPNGVVAAAACLFGVATFLRQSNFIPTTPGDGRHLLTRGDVQVDAAGLRARIQILSRRILYACLGFGNRCPRGPAFLASFHRGPSDRDRHDDGLPSSPPGSEMAHGQRFRPAQPETDGSPTGARGRLRPTRSHAPWDLDLVRGPLLCADAACLVRTDLVQF